MGCRDCTGCKDSLLQHMGCTGSLLHTGCRDYTDYTGLLRRRDYMGYTDSPLHRGCRGYTDLPPRTGYRDCKGSPPPTPAWR